MQEKLGYRNLAMASCDFFVKKMSEPRVTILEKSAIIEASQDCVFPSTKRKDAEKGLPFF